MNTRNILLLISIAALLLIGIIIGERCNSKQPQTPKSIAKIKAAPVQHKVDAGGTDHAVKQIAVGSVDDIRKSYESKIDSLMKLIKVKPSKIDSYLAVGTQTTGSLDNEAKRASNDFADGLCDDSLSFSDSFTVIKAVKKDGEWKLQYHFKDSLNFIAYWKKRSLFVDGFSYNKNTTITGLGQIQVPSQKIMKWGLGPNVSAVYIGGKIKPIPGFGLQYNLIRF